MNKEEFAKLTGADPSADAWEVVHAVYQWHPSITDTKGKQQIAELWKIGGYPLIASLFPAAATMESLDRRKREATKAHAEKAGEIAQQILQLQNQLQEEQTRFDEEYTAFIRKEQAIKDGTNLGGYVEPNRYIIIDRTAAKQYDYATWGEAKDRLKELEEAGHEIERNF